MRIGIGITTYNRPECLKECLENIEKHTKPCLDYGVVIYTARDTDEDRRGVAFRKNQCLRFLKDCDYVFLFDDDCFPIKDDWIEFFINSRQEHLLYLDRKLHGNYSVNGNINNYQNCGGVFMFMTKKAIEKAGAFDEKFGIYGFEHVDYSIRILGNRHQYPELKDTWQYLYAHDYSPNRSHNHKSSITDEEKRTHIKNNWDKFFKEPIKDIYIPL